MEYFTVNANHMCIHIYCIYTHYIIYSIRDRRNIAAVQMYIPVSLYAYKYVHSTDIVEFISLVYPLGRVLFRVFGLVFEYYV